MIVLIPAYQPSGRLPELVAGLGRRAPELGVLVVDDGSGPEFAEVFQRVRALGAEIIGTPDNRGKGAALKAGFRRVRERHPGEGVVTADADGQHRVADILAVAARLDGDALVLGVRGFSGMPLRSSIGNRVTAALFRAVAGYRLGDTQTGLRGIPAAALAWAEGVRGSRFEYELEVLVAAPRAGWRVAQVPIATVYLERNAGSHFRPIRDSLRVLAPLLRFAGSSLLAFGIDVALLQLAFWSTGSLLLSVIVARLVSATANFAVNRLLVFPGGSQPLRRAVLGYAALAGVLLVANYLWLAGLTALGLPLLAAKAVTEAGLYAASFAIQRSVVFARGLGGAAQQPHRDRIAASGSMVSTR